MALPPSSSTCYSMGTDTTQLLLLCAFLSPLLSRTASSPLDTYCIYSLRDTLQQHETPRSNLCFSLYNRDDQIAKVTLLSALSQWRRSERLLEYASITAKSWNWCLRMTEILVEGNCERSFQTRLIDVHGETEQLGLFLFRRGCNSKCR